MDTYAAFRLLAAGKEKPHASVTLAAAIATRNHAVLKVVGYLNTLPFSS